MTTVGVDVAVVGGGIQGLVVLRELVAEGYACVLVTNTPLGAGQTLHSHGALISGMGLVTGALSETVETVTAPYLRDLGVGVHDEDPTLLGLPQGMVTELAPVWRANGYEPRRCEPSIAPGFELGAPPYRVTGFNVDKRSLVEALSAGLEPHLLAGEVGAGGDELHVRTTRGEDVRLHAGAVVIAAGCGTKALLRERFGITGGIVDRITYSTMHMVCLRAPAGVLPLIGAVVTPDLFVVGHRRDDRHGPGAGGVTWFATPADSSAVQPTEAPGDATADVEPPLVTLAVGALQRMVPVLRRDDERIRATVFAGYKQDVDGEPTKRLCGLVDPDRNLVVALPSVLANAVPNALDAVALLRTRIEPSGGPPPTIAGSGHVAVGEPEEDRREDWRRWADFFRAYVS